MNVSNRTKISFLVVCLVILGTVTVSARQTVAAEPVLQPEPPQPQIASNVACLSCHDTEELERTLPSGEVLDLTIDPEAFSSSVHGDRACFQCHPAIDRYPHPPVTAETRREYVLQRYESCASCHPEKYQREMDSVHQEALEEGDLEAAVCTDCHGAHDVAPSTEPLSRPSQMCQQCHSEIYDRYAESVHGEALLGEGNPDVPGCTDCHTVHGVQPATTSEFHLFSPEICARCHADEELMEEYGLSTEILETYVSDFHGTTVKLFQEVAPGQETNKPVCVDCHGVHDIRGADDPESTVMKENILHTCQRCHPNADTNFPASWLGHYRPDSENNPVVFFVNIFYDVLIPVVLGGMVLFILIDAGRRIYNRVKQPQKSKSMATKPKKKEEKEKKEEEKREKFLRFPLVDRIQHWVLTASFTILAITGLVQKFPKAGISVWTVDLLGGIEPTRIIHRISAIVLLVEVVYHAGVLGYRLFVLRRRPTMLPGIEDAQAAVQWILYNLGLRQERPKEGQYNFAEKMEYWALIWGTAVMAITGFMLWNPITTSDVLPGQVIPAAKVAHGMEAILASLAILIWHVYHVHIKHWNKSMFTGYLSREEMEKEHPLELERIEEYPEKDLQVPAGVKRRKTTFAIVYGILAVVMLVGIYLFVTYEDTALETVPPGEEVPVYAPSLPTPTPSDSSLLPDADSIPYA
jgi:formate dehydrogenase gamma subunit